MAGCKRIEKESLRWARWELQQRFSALQVDSTLSTAAQPFQPRVAPQSSQEDDATRRSLVRHGLAGSSPAPGFAPGPPLRRAFPSHHQSSDDDGVGTDTSIVDRTPCRRCGSRRSCSSHSGSDSDGTRSSGGRRKKKDGFLSKIQIPEFRGKKGHAHNVAGAFRQWAHCITYYHDYYEDSYLMSLVVSSLMGDASDVFDWIRSLNPGDTQDLTTLLQMLREHYCGSLTFREHRNTIENLHQEPWEAAIDFLIRVGTSVSNLGKDWKDELTDEELQFLQYEVSMNRVHKEIRHILDSKIAKNGGKLTPQQMYEAVKKYKTYVAHNKRLEARVPVRPPRNQRLLARLLAISLDSIRPQLLLPPSLRLGMTVRAVLSHHPRKRLVPMAMTHLRKTTRGCTSPVIWRRPYPMTLLSK